MYYEKDNKRNNRSYNIITIDGVKGELPNTKEIKDNYKLSKSCCLNVATHYSFLMAKK